MIGTGLCNGISTPAISFDPVLSQKYVAPKHIVKAPPSHRNEVLNPGSKRLEIGYFNAKNPLTVYILAEGFPVWLLSLDATWCCGLILVGATSLEVFLLPFSQGLRDMLLLLLEPFLRNRSLSFCSRSGLS